MEEIIVLQSVILQLRTGIINFDERSIWIRYWFACEKLPIAGRLYVVVVLLLQGNIWGCQMMPKVMPNHDRQVPVDDGCLHWKLKKIAPWYPFTTNQAVYCMVLSTIFRPTSFVTKTSTQIGEPICIKSGVINWYLQVSQHTPDIFSSGKTVTSTSSPMSNIHQLIKWPTYLWLFISESMSIYCRLWWFIISFSSGLLVWCQLRFQLFPGQYGSV